MMEFVICLFVVAVPPLENFVYSGKQKKQRRKLKSRKRKKNLIFSKAISYISYQFHSSSVIWVAKVTNLGSKGNKFHQSW